MSYEHIIREMKWSYSRITAFEFCPYKWFMTYIKKVDRKPMFFSDYGSFMHSILEKHFKGELSRDELVSHYIVNYKREVRGKMSNKNIAQSYYNQGFSYLEDFSFPYESPIAVEQEVEFKIRGYDFVGYIDYVGRDDGGIIIVDNKSRALKPRSKRAKPTKSDEELDDYLRQLYTYAIPVKEIYGEYPKRLEFNCFRTKTFISEPFIPERLIEVEDWVENTIESIAKNTDWSTRPDYFKCANLCECNNLCEHYEQIRKSMWKKKR